jgi:hypothetical protein
MNNVDLDYAMFVENIFFIHIPGGMLGTLEVGWNRDLDATCQTGAQLRMLRFRSVCSHKLSKNPELAEGLDKTLRRDRISALADDIFCERSSRVDEMLLLPRVQLRRIGRKLDWRKLLLSKASVGLSLCSEPRFGVPYFLR